MMKKFNLFRISLFIPVMIILFTSCSDSEDDITDEIEIVWEKTVIKGCLNKDPFAFGPASDYSVSTGDNIGHLYYNKYGKFGVGLDSYVITEGHDSYKVDYNFGSLIEDSKTKDLYVLNDDFYPSELYEVDKSNYLRGAKLLVNTAFKMGNNYEIFDDQLFIIEPMDDDFQLVMYSLDMSEKKILRSFITEAEEKVRLLSIYEYGNKDIGIFQIFKTKAPYDRGSVLMVVDVESGELLWEDDQPHNIRQIHHLNEELYVFINNEKSEVYNILNGEKLRTLSALANEGSLQYVSENIMVVREREYEDNYPIKEWSKAYDLHTELEVFSMEGSFLGENNGRFYTIDDESILRIRSINDNDFSKKMDLSEVRNEHKLYDYWNMANGSNLLFGQDDQCDVSYLILIELP